MEMETPGVPHLLTAPEAARVLRVSTRTFRRIIASGALRVSRIGQRVLVTSEELTRYVNDRSGLGVADARPLGVPPEPGARSGSPERPSGARARAEAPRPPEPQGC